MQSRSVVRFYVPALLLTVACGTDGDSDKHEEAEAFSLQFKAVANGANADCATPVTGLGPAGAHSIGINDIRFFVSNLHFLDETGAELVTTLDNNDFQYTGTTGWVGLIDLTDSSSGTCAASSISFSEGTARTNEQITGTTELHHVAGISFDIGVPQALMQEVIGANSSEGAPSPLNELQWSWATGYRHLAFNMTVSDGVDSGEGYLHVGSVDCAADGELALETRDSCGLVNTPTVAFDGFNPETNVVTLDLPALLAGLDFLSPIYDPVTFEVIGDGVGLECHSSSMQPDCQPLFTNVGLDLATGTANASNNHAFGME